MRDNDGETKGENILKMLPIWIEACILLIREKIAIYIYIYIFILGQSYSFLISRAIMCR